MTHNASTKPASGLAPAPIGAYSTAYVEALEKHYVTSQTLFSALVRQWGRLSLTSTDQDEAGAKGMLAGLRQAHANGE